MNALGHLLKHSEDFLIAKTCQAPFMRGKRIQHPHGARLREIFILEFMEIVQIPLGLVLELGAPPLDEQDHLGTPPFFNCST